MPFVHDDTRLTLHLGSHEHQSEEIKAEEDLEPASAPAEAMMVYKIRTGGGEEARGLARSSLRVVRRLKEHLRVVEGV